MAFEANTGSTSISFGTNLRIGYRTYGGITPFTYLTHFPTYNELPYTFNLPGPGVWEIEYSVICAGCSGSTYSAPDTVVVTIS